MLLQSPLISFRRHHILLGANAIDRFCSLNVCGENDDWFLMMNSERILIFGCTEARAAEFELSRLRQIPHPIDYTLELDQRRQDFERFKRDFKRPTRSAANKADFGI